mmetsp:Transcript_7070/g.16215  ORF Transcript_7070/g.16215 Transcript_7070/m.16215 type:complete len:203 (+) Transcript_7070:147-755(+)
MRIMELAVRSVYRTSSSCWEMSPRIRRLSPATPTIRRSCSMRGLDSQRPARFERALAAVSMPFVKIENSCLEPCPEGTDFSSSVRACMSVQYALHIHKQRIITHSTARTEKQRAIEAFDTASASADARPSASETRNKTMAAMCPPPRRESVDSVTIFKSWAPAAWAYMMTQSTNAAVCNADSRDPHPSSPPWWSMMAACEIA